MSPAALACVVALAWGAPQDGYGVHELRLEGPLGAVVLEGSGWRTSVVGEVGPGEVCTLVVPIVAGDAPRGAAPGAPLLSPADGAGDAVLTPAIAAAPEWDALPAGLRRRTLPPVAARLPGPGAAHLALLCAVAVLILAAWRRTPAALALGLAGALACFVLPQRPPQPSAVEVLEGDGASGRWLVVRGAVGTLELSPDRPGWCESIPASAKRRLEVTLDGGPHWALEGEGLALYSLAEAGRLGRLDPERNELADLASVWRRDGAGRWSAHGPWGHDEALPAAVEGGGEPPGWLVSVLPQGVGITVGRAEAGAAGTPRWVRWIEGPSFGERR
ncbi:MAG: hypothetical protein QF903_16080 [Planctomycetota bacterium]|jgi:hypothetical protein|nr:hypothetical protein [Planctomycetota bacterium]MDP6990989.1 hypothetical protein [Planctomycetota bacterium]